MKGMIKMNVVLKRYQIDTYKHQNKELLNVDVEINGEEFYAYVGKIETETEKKLHYYVNHSIPNRCSKKRCILCNTTGKKCMYFKNPKINKNFFDDLEKKVKLKALVEGNINLRPFFTPDPVKENERIPVERRVKNGSI
jgi:hypothetical protein